jgi:hypothetical protein
MTPIPDDEEENVSKWKVLANHFHSSVVASYKRGSGTESSSHNSLNCLQKSSKTSSKQQK